MKFESVKQPKDRRAFLAEQITLPSSEWSEEFKTLIEEKKREVQIEEDISPEEERQRIYERYLHDLDLQEEDLRGKRVVDLGCGESATFVHGLVEKGITQEAYGFDRDVENMAHTMRHDYTKKFPVEDIDIAISEGSLTSIMYTKPDVVEKVINNALDALKENGEIRVYPVFKASPDNDDVPGIHQAEADWEKLLRSLKNIEYEFRPIDIEMSGGHKNDIFLAEMLVIRKQRSKERA